MTPSNEQRAGRPEHDKQTEKHHIFAPTAGARSTIFLKLWLVIEDVEAIKMVSSIFRSNTVLLQGAQKNSG